MNAPHVPASVALPAGSDVVGAPQPHDSAALHAAGAARYTDDLPEPRDMLHVAVGVSPVAHGRVRRVDLDAVTSEPGVVAVIDARDVPGVNDVGPIVRDDPIFAVDEVQFAGQPLFAVTARDGVDDRVAGLNLGADDYVVKPFATEELAARLRAVLRRPVEALALRLAVGNVELDPAQGAVSVRGKGISVPRKELAILELLMRRAGRVVARGAIEQGVYSLGEEIGSNAIDANISRLRRRLSESESDLIIHAVRGVGYMLTVAPTPDSVKGVA